MPSLNSKFAIDLKLLPDKFLLSSLNDFEINLLFSQSKSPRLVKVQDTPQEYYANGLFKEAALLNSSAANFLTEFEINKLFKSAVVSCSVPFQLENYSLRRLFTEKTKCNLKKGPKKRKISVPV